MGTSNRVCVIGDVKLIGADLEIGIRNPCAERSAPASEPVRFGHYSGNVWPRSTTSFA
jgi:hypothetical protein